MMGTIISAHQDLFDRVAALRPTSGSIWPIGSPEDLRAAFGRYEDAVSSCVWQQSSRPLWDWRSGMVVTLHLPPTDWTGNTSSMACSIPAGEDGIPAGEDGAQDRGGWLVKRIGPLVSYGGYDWQQAIPPWCSRQRTHPCRRCACGVHKASLLFSWACCLFCCSHPCNPCCNHLAVLSATTSAVISAATLLSSC